MTVTARRLWGALQGVGWRRWLMGAGAGAALGLGQAAYIGAGLAARYPDQALKAYVMVGARWAVLLGLLGLAATAGAAVLREVERERPLRAWDHLLFVAGVASAAAVVGETVSIAVLQRVHVGIGFRSPPFWQGMAWPGVLWASWSATLPMLIVAPAFWTLARVWSARAGQAARLLDGAQLRLVEAQRRVLAAQLGGAQAMVDPGFLFGTLSAIEERFESQPARSARMLDALIRFLRAAMPVQADAPSTLGQQGELVRAWLDIEGLRSLDGLQAEVQVPEPLGGRPFAPLLLLPLVAQVVQLGLGPARVGHVEVQAAAAGGRLVVRVSARGEGTEASKGGRLPAELQARLAALYGPDAQLVVETGPAGARGRIEIHDPQGSAA
jgi:hypothetical protein